MDLERLVKQTKSNPYVLWPNYNYDSYIDGKLNEITNDSEKAKCFEYYSGSNLICYFQVSKLDWDSQHFGYNCGKLSHLYIEDHNFIKNYDHKITQIKNDLFNYLKKENYKFIFCDIDTNPGKNILMQEFNFKYIVSWIDGFLPVTNYQSKYNSYALVKNDIEIESIADIAKCNYYKGGRFYSDFKFDVNKIDNMYYSLVKNAYKNGEIVLTIKYGGNPVGAFISKKMIKYNEFDNLKVAHLRFLVVDKKFRGMNYGEKLFDSVLNYFKKECDIIVTGLETCNTISLNLHNKYKFIYNYTHNAYHLWL